MRSRVTRRAATLALSFTLVAVGMFIAPAATLAAPVSTTVHRQIGFEASVPFDETESDSEEVCAPFCVEVASYEVRAIGTANIRVAHGRRRDLQLRPGRCRAGRQRPDQRDLHADG